MEYRFCDSCKKELIKSETIPTEAEIDIRVSDLYYERIILDEALSKSTKSLMEIEHQNEGFFWYLISIFGFDIKPKELKSEIINLRSQIHDSEINIKGIDGETNFLLALKKRNIYNASIRYKHKIEIDEQLRRNMIEKRNQGFERIIRLINYNREDFIIRKSDYKRGNQLDNFVRNELFEPIAKIFENKCISCAKEADLTLDHFWLPKNEGGNFIMIHKETNTIVSNVIVLCKSCNSAKGDRTFDKFFSSNQIMKILTYHKNSSLFFQNDSSTCIRASKWYGKPILLLNGDSPRIDSKTKRYYKNEESNQTRLFT